MAERHVGDTCVDGTGPDPVGPGTLISRTLSRRRFLQASAGLGALVLLGVLPDAAEGAASPLTARMLTSAMAKLPRKGSVRLPSGGSVQASDLRAAAAAFAMGEGTVGDPTKDPVTALGILVALAAWSGKAGSVDLRRTLPASPLSPLRLGLHALPSGAETTTPTGALPPGLVLRPGGTLVLVGTAAGSRVLVAVEDPIRTVASHPRLELVLLPASFLGALLAAAGARLDLTGSTVTLASGSKVILRRLDPSLAARLVSAAGSRFVDLVPLQPKGATSAVLTAVPVVPSPPASLRAVGVSQQPDGRVLALDAGGKAVGRAIPTANGRWLWAGGDTTTSFLRDYTPREYADAAKVGVTAAVYPPKVSAGYVQTPGGWVRNPEDPAYVARFEAIANRLDYNGYDLAVPFYAFTAANWKQVVTDWKRVSTALASGEVPEGFPFYWDDVDQTLAFAQAEGYPVRIGVIGMDLPDAIRLGGFSKAELGKILEFTARSKILHLRGKVEDWVVVSEAAQALAAGDAQSRFWWDALGEGAIDEAYRWARHDDPLAKLSYGDDLILEHYDFQFVPARFWALLEHFRSASVPVDRIAIENNFWVYHPPRLEEMVAGLRRVHQLGFENGAPQTTVMLPYPFPRWSSRLKEVDVTDPLAAQAAIYRDTAEAYLEVGAPFGVSGISDADSFFNDLGIPNAGAMLLDRQWQPKPAYFAVRDVLKKAAGLG